MVRHINVLTILAVVALAGTSVHAGSIAGKVDIVNGNTNKDAVVYIDTIPGRTFPPPQQHATMDQQDLIFIPHVLPVLVGTTVDFLNNDTVLHNVFSPDKTADKLDLGTYPQGQSRSHTFDKLGEPVMLCHLHPEMEAYVVVLPTPYFGVTDEDGSYRIEGVPAGTYTLKVWDEQSKKQTSRRVVVGDAGAVTVNFEVRGR